MPITASQGSGSRASPRRGKGAIRPGNARLGQIGANVGARVGAQIGAKVGARVGARVGAVALILAGGASAQGSGEAWLSTETAPMPAARPALSTDTVASPITAPMPSVRQTAAFSAAATTEAASPAPKSAETAARAISDAGPSTAAGETADRIARTVRRTVADTDTKGTGIVGSSKSAQGAGGPRPVATQGPGAFLDGVDADPGQVALIADSVTYDSDAGTVTAEGSVEVFYGPRTLTAERIVYDSNTGRISAEGSIVLRDPTGTTVYADAADIDAELYDGIVLGAQSVIATSVLEDDQPRQGSTARLAAVEARRVDGRYNTLSRAVYSPCDVCVDDPTPLWRIRARRVIHDEQERTIHYENATFDVFGVPVAWLPFFSHPDPTVERATGFLVPSVTDSSTYGLGVRVPFFWAIDPSTDFLFQPFITSEDGIVLDGELRRAFDFGDLRFRGSIVQTDYTGDARLQGHVDTDASFDVSALGDTAEFGWDIIATSDDAYLRFFDISNEDRLTSSVFLRGYERDHFFDVEGIYFQSLRDDEPSGPIPTVIPRVDARYEFDDPLVDGRLGFFMNTQTLLRDIGSDTTRVTLGADWEREWITSPGLVLRGFASLRGDLFLTFDDAGSSDFSDEANARVVPLGGVEARFPLISDDTVTGVHVIEPLVRFEATPFDLNNEDFTNEDSLQTEFDELSLFDIDRFSGLDAVEEGPRFTLGLRYERLSEDGITFSADGGRIFRFADADEFDVGSGLNGDRSDYVLGWRIGFTDIVSLRNRLRFDDEFKLNRNEASLEVDYGPASVSIGYAFLEAIPEAGAEDDRQEVTSLAQIQVTDEWGIQGYMQRDLEEDEFVEVGGGVSYANECCAVDLIAKRRFASSEDSPASTSVGFQVRLLTLGTGAQPRGLFGAGDIGRPGGGIGDN
ncbi:MAG: LPS assembly protein LptD [Pseudomonadota bacterium]